MSRKEMLQKLTQVLVKRRTALAATVMDQQRMIAVDERTVGDHGDAAVDCEQDELDSQLASFESRELAAIDAALERNEKGQFGICEGCAKPIPTARLKAIPYATYCVRCQELEEQEPRQSSRSSNWEYGGGNWNVEARRDAIRLDLDLV